MSSFYKQFILDLQAKFKDEVPEIKFIDQNLGQWGDASFTTSGFFPGMLIDFPDTDFSEMQGNDQLGVPNIKISLFFNTHAKSYNIAPESEKLKALDYYNIEQKVVGALQGWSTDYFRPLMRTKILSRNQNELNLRIRELFFSSEYEENFSEDITREVTFGFSGQIQQIGLTD